VHEGKDHLSGNSVVGREKGHITKEVDEDVEELHRKKKGFHADQTEGKVRDASWKGRR